MAVSLGFSQKTAWLDWFRLHRIKKEAVLMKTAFF